MSLHLQRQIGQIKKSILQLGTMTEESLQDAIQAIESRDPELALQVIARDNEIDQMEVDIEEDCLGVLALHQPVAFDLRYVVAVLKINAELERIGGLAVNIADQAIALSEMGKIDVMPFDLGRMTMLVRTMVKQSLDALVTIDPAMAEDVRRQDDEVDRMHREMYGRMEAAIREDPELVRVHIRLISVSRYLERIADHAVAIAEDVIYTAEGRIQRHTRPTRNQ